MNEDRKKLWEEYQGDKPDHLRHPWLDYSRYRYSHQIIQTLKERQINLGDFTVLDYGCGVGDYGFDFGRNDSEVIFYDNATYIPFIKFRWTKEYKKFNLHAVTIATGDFFKDFVLGDPAKIDLVIFGEVLEHLTSPLTVIQQFVSQKTKYIFTSSYPFRNDSPSDDYWHHPGHEEHDKPRIQQPEIRGLLQKYYDRIHYNGEASLWVRK